MEWYCSEPRLALNRISFYGTVHTWISWSSSRNSNLRLGAVRRLAFEAADCGLLSGEAAAGGRRVKGMKKLGVRLGNWQWLIKQ